MAQVIHNISTPNDGLGDDLRSAFDNQNQMNTELYGNKVDKELGKGLSSNDFTNADKAKLDDLPTDAEKNVQSDWAQSDDTADDYIKNKPTLEYPTLYFLDGIIGVTTGFIVGQQNFTIPASAVCERVYINGALQYPTTNNNTTLTNRWVQVDDVVTITKTTVLNNYILIEYRL